jgi:hypothetical protein
MSRFEWEYRTEDDAATAVYPTNGTGNLATEGYGQLLPAAIASEECRVVNVLTASVYGSVNVEEEGRLQEHLRRGIQYDRRKAEFIADRFEADTATVGATTVSTLWEQGAYWQTLSDTIAGTDRATIRTQSPVPDWFARKTVAAPTWFDAVRAEGYPVPETLIDRCERFRAADLYLPLQVAEAVTIGESIVIGLRSERPFHEFTARHWTGASFRRSTASVNIDGEPIDPPYLRKTAAEPQIRLTDSPEEIAGKLASATDRATAQFEGIARRLDREVWQAVKPACRSL